VSMVDFLAEESSEEAESMQDVKDEE